MRRVGRLLALAWTAVALWCFFLAVLPDDNGFGEANRQHAGLLMLQSLCAVVAAATTLALGESYAKDERRGRVACVVLLAVAVVGFALVFTKPDLLTWGAYEN